MIHVLIRINRWRELIIIPPPVSWLGPDQLIEKQKLVFFMRASKTSKIILLKKKKKLEIRYAAIFLCLK